MDKRYTVEKQPEEVDDTILERFTDQLWRIELACDGAYKCNFQTHLDMNSLHEKMDAFITTMKGKIEDLERIHKGQPAHFTSSDEIYQVGLDGENGKDKKPFLISIVDKVTGEYVKFSVDQTSKIPTWKNELYEHKFFQEHLLRVTGGFPFSVQVQWIYNKPDSTELKKCQPENDSVDFHLYRGMDKPIITLFSDRTMIKKVQFDIISS